MLNIHNCQDVVAKRKSKPELNKQWLWTWHSDETDIRYRVTGSFLIGSFVSWIRSLRYPHMLLRTHKEVIEYLMFMETWLIPTDIFNSTLNVLPAFKILLGWWWKFIVFVNILSLKNSTLHVTKHLSDHMTIIPNSAFIFFSFWHRLSLCPQGWPESCSNSLTKTSKALVLQAWATWLDSDSGF